MAAFTVDLLVYPLDTLKTRQQSQDFMRTFAEAGAPPGRSARGPWAKAVDRLLATVLEASDEG